MVVIVRVDKEDADTIPRPFEIRTTQDSGSGAISLTLVTGVKGATVALIGIDSHRCLTTLSHAMFVHCKSLA